MRLTSPTPASKRAGAALLVVLCVLGLSVIGCGSANESDEATATTCNATVARKVAGTIEGIDIGIGQKNPDWPRVRQSGIDFAIIKATQGTSYKQEYFGASWKGAKSAGVIRGAYHYFEPN